MTNEFEDISRLKVYSCYLDVDDMDRLKKWVKKMKKKNKSINISSMIRIFMRDGFKKYEI